MQLEERDVGPVTLLELNGRLTLQTVGALRLKVDTLVAKGRTLLLLDCRQVTAIDSWGLGGLVRAWVSVGRQGGKLKLLQPSPHLRDTLRLTGLVKVIELFDDLSLALRSF